jgi:hypothetical protein
MFDKIYMWFKGICSNNTIEEQENERLADLIMIARLRSNLKKMKEEGRLKKIVIKD